MQENFIIKGFKKAYIVENDASQETELLMITKEMNDFPSEEEIDYFMIQNGLDRCEVTRSYRRTS